MPSRRSEIQMSEPEFERLLDEERVVTVATILPSGRPHLMPLWYVHEGTTIVGWTFGKSQKVKNLERDPRATLQIEAGDRYQDCAARCWSATSRSSATPRASPTSAWR